MKHFSQYINVRKEKSIIKATDETIKKIVQDELDRLGHDADLNHIDVSKVTSMYTLFSCYTSDLGPNYGDMNPDISNWNVSNVKNMKWMFYWCKNFNTDISCWDVSNVENMRCMFYYCKNFNQDISGWDVSNVENMGYMFSKCENFNQDLSQWNVNNVKNYDKMFDYCHIEEEFKPHFVK